MKKFCFLDLETTGFDPEKDSIIEVSFITFEGEAQINEVDQVCIPDKSELTDFITHLTGITLEEVASKGRNLSEIKDEIQSKIGDAYIVGHNIDFDINFLVANGIDISKNPRIDTHELSRILLPNENSFALEVLSQKYGFVHENAHRAMSDVIASKKLFHFLEKKIKNIPTTFLKNIRPFLETNTHWDAKKLFLETSETEQLSTEKESKQTTDNIFEESGVPAIQIDTLTNENACFIKIGDAQKSANYFKEIAQSLQEKSIIITPKLNFFEDTFETFPIPEMLFDPEKIELWKEGQETLNDQETTFYIKCQLRHFLGYSEQKDFDLFFKERDLWKKTCLQEISHPIYQTLLAKKDPLKTSLIL